MTFTHLVLGKPWLLAPKVKLDVEFNTYTFRYSKYKIKLISDKVVKPQVENKGSIIQNKEVSNNRPSNDGVIQEESAKAFPENDLAQPQPWVEKKSSTVEETEVPTEDSFDGNGILDEPI